MRTKQKNRTRELEATHDKRMDAALLATERVAKELTAKIAEDVDDFGLAPRAAVMAKRHAVMHRLLNDYRAAEVAADGKARETLDRAAAAIADKVLDLLPGLTPAEAKGLAMQHGDLDTERAAVAAEQAALSSASEKRTAASREFWRLAELTAVERHGADYPENMNRFLREGGLK